MPLHKILIVEDDKDQCNKLYNCLKQEYPTWNIYIAYTYNEGQNNIQISIDKNEPFSLFLLDVQLSEQESDIGGFELANYVRSNNIYYQTPILFLTSISDKMSYALSNFHCYNYINKPYTTKEIISEIQQMMLTGYITENTLYVIDTDRIRHRVAPRDIFFIEAKSHILIIETLNGRITSRQTKLSDLLDLLSDDFIQCHKKYVININYVNNYDKQNHLINIGKYSIPTSRTYKDFLEEKLSNR